MIFKFLEKPITITAFTSVDYSFANTYAPVVPALRFYPKWMKNLPSEKFNLEEFRWNQNVKSCAGIIGTFQSGFIIPLWSDLAISTTENSWKYHYSDERSSLSIHKNEQATGFFEDHYIFKLHSPWMLKTSRDLKILVCQPFYSTNEKLSYFTPYAINQTTNKILSTNIFIFCKKEKNSFMIKHNTPILHLIPLTEKKVKIKTEILNDLEFQKINSVQNTIIQFNRSGFQKIKILNENKKDRENR